MVFLIVDAECCVSHWSMVRSIIPAVIYSSTRASPSQSCRK